MAKHHRSKKESLRINLLDKEQMEGVAYTVLQKMQENEGMTLKEATGVSDEALEEIYSLAYTFYNQGKYKEAMALFQYLSLTASSTYKYLFGLAACYHQVQAYEQAAVGFYVALNIEPEDPIPAYYIMDCFLKQDLYEEAEEFADITITICEDKEPYRELKQRAELIKNSLKENKLSK